MGIVEGTRLSYPLKQTHLMSSVKAQVVNILGFASHVVSIITTQLCGCSMKTVIDNT